MEIFRLVTNRIGLHAFVWGDWVNPLEEMIFPLGFIGSVWDFYVGARKADEK